MKKPFKYTVILPGLMMGTLLLQSCFKEIDTVSIPRTVEETITVQNSIREIQTYLSFYQFDVLEVHTVSPRTWDLTFESAGEGNRVLIGWANYSQAIGTGKYDFAEISQELILDLLEVPGEWSFDDPAYLNETDSLTLTNWENGEVFIHNRGLSDDSYYAIQFVSRDEDSYTFRYASARSLDQVNEASLTRGTGFNYLYFSYDEGTIDGVEPMTEEWDLVCTPYRGWWETGDSDVYAPFNLSGILINNESGIRIARVFDPEVSFEELELASIHAYEFTDMKGAIGSNWKLLGDQNSGNIYTMDPNKKYLMEKYDVNSGRLMYFKLQIVDYRLDGADHHPTIEFKYLGEG